MEIAAIDNVVEVDHSAEDASALLDTKGSHRQRPRRLADEPIVRLQAGRSRWALNLRELWHYRELLYFLTWRDVRVRYKQTALGVAWVIVQPLLSTVIFAVFLGRLAHVPSDGAPYPLFVLAGLLPWTFFSSAVTSSATSVVANSNLITKVYFPRMIIPLASVCARLVDFLVAFMIVGVLLFYYGVAPTPGLLWLPVLIVLIALLAAGVGIWASAVNVKYRDMGIVLPVLVQFWMFVSPVVYPSALVPDRFRWLYSLNPLVGILGAFRSALFGHPLAHSAVSVSAIFSVMLLLYSAHEFRRVDRSFADRV